MEILKKWAPYIGIAVGVVTVFFLYRQHLREEKQASVELELIETQLEDLKKKQA